MNQVQIEIRDIREKLKKFRPDQVIWDTEDLSAKPPRGDDISLRITDLSNYFVTSTGRDLLEAIIENVEFLKRKAGRSKSSSIRDTRLGRRSGGSREG